MSVRRSPATNAPVPNHTRLQTVLAAGHSQRAESAPTHMNSEGPAYRGAYPAGTSRKVLALKGFVAGIDESNMDIALNKATKLIEAEGITTLVWDGDKYTYPGLDGVTPPAGSFTRLIPALLEKFPHLECVWFKKVGSAGKLIMGSEEPEEDAHKNVLGPFPTFTSANTRIQYYELPLPPYMPGVHTGVEFPYDKKVHKWYQLGLWGLEYVKNTMGVEKIAYMITGVGGAVKKELEKVAEEPGKYPAGVSAAEAVVTEQARAW